MRRNLPSRGGHADLLFLRRLIGRRFDDPTVKKDIESWPFKVVDDATQPKIEVEYLGEKKQFSAQEISSMVLLKVHSRANSIAVHVFVRLRTTSANDPCR